jgi:hypothetical protein
VIICSRCGKENQKHYKFCLGCGAKLEQPAPVLTPEPLKVPTVAPERAPSPIEVAKTAPPAAPAGFNAGVAPSAAPAAAAGEVPFPVSPSGLSRAALSAPPGASFVAAPTAGPGGAGLAPVVAAPVPAPPLALPETDGIQPGPAVPARDIIPCPKCGKPVIATYAFCGACGQRMKPTGAGPAAAPVQKTMYMAPQVAKNAPRGHLTLIRPDGTEGGVHPLHEGENLIGRGQGSLFDADPYLSPRHAEFLFTDDGLVVRDLRSLNGVFLKITQEELLESGDIFRIGQELLRFDVIAPPTPLEDGTEIIGTPNPGYWGRISVIVGRDVDGPAFPLYDESVVLGRERGDILFPEDGYVSGTHAQITLRDGQVYLSDLGSSNGTFFRIRSSRTVPSGSLLLMGQQLFRASYR